MNRHSKIFLIVAGVFGAFGIGLAAVGAHALHDQLVAHQFIETFAKAVDYTIYGALALVAIALLQEISNATFYFCGYAFALGTLCFSGSLFCHTLLGWSFLTVVTPFGGTLLILAWLLLAITAIVTKKKA